MKPPSTAKVLIILKAKQYMLKTIPSFPRYSTLRDAEGRPNAPIPPTFSRKGGIIVENGEKPVPMRVFRWKTFWKKKFRTRKTNEIAILTLWKKYMKHGSEQVFFFFPS